MSEMTTTRPLTTKDRYPLPGDVVAWYGKEYKGTTYQPPSWSAASVVRCCFYMEGKDGYRSVFPGDLPYVVYASRADGGPVTVEEGQGGE